jgi:16S rRNA (guanine966-N2)-methyltransferase
MRVIAGRAGGVRLSVPKAGVRPTMDRVKAAIFSSLGEVIVGASVLDLFAGSGALGIEALSRGASSALFVDCDREAISAIEKNLAKTRLRARVRQGDVLQFLTRFRSSEKFRVIFADPPYERMELGTSYSAELLADRTLPRLLEPSGIFVLEKQPEEALPELPLWRIIRQKTYGATEVLFLESAIGREFSRLGRHFAIL